MWVQGMRLEHAFVWQLRKLEASVWQHLCTRTHLVECPDDLVQRDNDLDLTRDLAQPGGSVDASSVPGNT
jgi:hypothetical protein